MAMSPVAPGSEASRALIAAIAAGDRDAFSRFYDLTAPMAFGLIRRVLRDPEAAAEVLQEVFWQVWQDAPRHDPTGGTAGGWVGTRAIRRRDRTLVAPVDESVAQRREDQAPNPAVVAEDRGLIQTALAQLPEPQRRISERASFEGATLSENARRLGEPLGTVKTRARLGLDRLRGALGGERL